MAYRYQPRDTFKETLYGVNLNINDICRATGISRSTIDGLRHTRDPQGGWTSETLATAIAQVYAQHAGCDVPTALERLFCAKERTSNRGSRPGLKTRRVSATWRFRLRPGDDDTPSAQELIRQAIPNLSAWAREHGISQTTFEHLLRKGYTTSTELVQHLTATYARHACISTEQAHTRLFTTEPRKRNAA